MTANNTPEPEETPADTQDSAGCAPMPGSASSEAKTEPASRLVWWLARTAMLQSYPRPDIKIGDTVVESSHLLGLCRHRLGLHSALGELVAIEGEWPYPKRYLIRSFDEAVGETWWSNAKIELVEQNSGIRPRGQNADKPTP